MTERKQYLIIANQVLTLNEITGVSQGSVVGPLFFLICISACMKKGNKNEKRTESEVFIYKGLVLLLFLF